MAYNLIEAQHTFLAALRAGDEVAARAVVQSARHNNVDPDQIYFDIFVPSMITIGELWERNELSVAEEHLATEITERLIGQLSPLFDQPTAKGQHAHVVLGCVAGERHALGLRMLADLFRQSGWRVLYLGADVPHADFVKLAVRFNADLVAISAGAERLLPAVQTLIAQLRAALPHTGVLVGGAAFAVDPAAWRTVGADVYQADPRVAVTLATTTYAHDTQPHAT